MWWGGYGGWWWWWVAVWIILLIFLVLMPFGWGYRRWGRPTYHYHPHRGARPDLDPTYRQSGQEPSEPLDGYDSGGGWAWWTVLIWAVLIGLLIWAAAAVWWY